MSTFQLLQGGLLLNSYLVDCGERNGVSILELMAKLKAGEPAPDVALQTLAGETARLAETWQNGRSALLIFLRHLA